MTNRSDRYAMKGARAILRARLRRGPVPCWYCGVLVTLEDDWHTAHFDTTGHRRFYRWRLERGTGRMYRF